MTPPSPHTLNPLHQPIGHPLPNFTPPPLPTHTPLHGHFIHLAPLTPTHFTALHQAFQTDTTHAGWTYLSYGPFPTLDAHTAWLTPASHSKDPLFFTLLPTATNTPAGLAAYLRISPSDASIEIGHLHFAPALQHTPASTEALFLLIDHAFSLGYRRVEWKCDALNAPSRRAAQRLGFQYEGTFRQATIYKNRNRDTAWFSLISPDWPTLRPAFTQWLHPANFTPEGAQRTSLSALTARQT